MTVWYHQRFSNIEQECYRKKCLGHCKPVILSRVYILELKSNASKLFSFNKFIYLFIFKFLGALGLLPACGLSLVAVSKGYSVMVCGLLTAVASLVAEHGL